MTRAMLPRKAKKGVSYVCNKNHTNVDDNNNNITKDVDNRKNDDNNKDNNSKENNDSLKLLGCWTYFKIKPHIQSLHIFEEELHTFMAKRFGHFFTSAHDHHFFFDAPNGAWRLLK